MSLSEGNVFGMAYTGKMFCTKSWDILTTSFNHVTLDFFDVLKLKLAKWPNWFWTAQGLIWNRGDGVTRRRKSYNGTFTWRQALLNDIMVSEELTCFWNPVQCFISLRVILRLRRLFSRLANASYMRLSDVEKEGVSTGWHANSQWDIQSRSFQHPPTALKHPRGRQQEYLDFISDEDRRFLLHLYFSAYLHSSCAARPEKQLESTQRVVFTWVSSHLHHSNLNGRFHRNANVICKYTEVFD